MSGGMSQHTKLDGIGDYRAAHDTLCKLARHELYLFEKDFDGLEYNSEARYTTLRNFLLANPAHRLFVLVHDAHYLSTMCPRMMTLLRQFGTSMFIRQTPKHLRHISDPFSVADSSHYLRRFHFDDPRGMLAQHDPENAQILKARFMEMWDSSRTSISPTKLGL
ncbi:MAG: hypothetical protein HY016_10760 [Nitrosomonadales bacterium]|nr:hypothetical protein [Nitrosomonadales bacterium]